MKRVKWLLLLCAFVLLWSSPGWAEVKEINSLDAENSGIEKTTSENVTTYDLNNGEYKLTAGYTQSSNINVVIKNGTITYDATNAWATFDVSAGTLTLEESLNITAGDTAIFVHGTGQVIVNGATITKATNPDSVLIAVGYVSGGYNYTGGTLIINSGSITDDVNTVIMADKSSDVTINGGTITTNAQMCTAYSKAGGKVTLNGGTLVSTKASGLIATKDSTVEVKSGEITVAEGWNAVLAHEGNATAKISGGTINGKVSAGGGNGGTGNKVEISGGSIKGNVVIGDVGEGKTTSNNTLTITGGMINGSLSVTESKGTLTISGGAFTADPSTYKAENAIVIPLSDNTYKYGVLASAPTVAVTVAADPASNLTKTYDGSGFDLTATASPAQIESIDIAYTYAWTKGGTALEGATTNTYKVAGNVADNGTYNCTATIKDSTYSASGSATVAITKAAITPTVTMTGWTYGATASTPSVSGNTGSGDVTYTYATKGASDYAATVPTNAGDYTVKATVAESDNYEGGTATADFTIAKANATVDTAPTAKTLTYTGSAQALVEAGTATGGTLQYAVGTTAGTYSSEIPTGTDAGSYTVWYQVIGDNNHENFTAKSLTVTIAKAPASEITTQVGGTTTGTATTTNGKTNTKTSKTTTFTLGSGTGASTMSADVAITTEEKLEAQAGSEFSTVVAVDTTLTGNKDFNQYAYSMDIVGLPSWITATGELTSSDTNAAGKTYHHEFTLKGTPAEAAEATSIAFTAWVTLSSDNYANALKASADKSVEVAVAARPVPPVAPVLRIVDASEDKSLIITADVTNGSVTLSPDVVVEATAGTNFVWIVSGDLPKYLTATSTDKTLTISGSISDDLIAYSIVVIASNDVGSDSVKISFNVYKAEIDDTGAVTVTITSEDIEKIKETKGSDELTLSDVVDMTALNETLASSGGALKLSNGITTLEGISDLSNLKTLDITEVATLTTKSLTADSLGSATEIKIGEKNTSITTVDLSGSKVETVTMQKSSVTDLKLGSSVKTVDAKDSANLTAIDFSQSTNVQTVNISGTQVASADLSNCTELVSFSFDVAPGDGTNSAGALQTLKLPETSDKLENLAVRGNQLLWLSLGSSKYPNLKNINVRGQRRGGLSIKMAFDFLEFLWNLYQQSLYENEADYEEYTEGAEMPFDVTQISSDITYVASDDNSTQTATITNGKVNFIKTPKNFKYEYDTGFRRSGRTASTGSFITAEDEDEENGNMDVTIETGSVTGSAGGLESSSGGGCDAGFSYGALSALMLVFATLKKRR